MHYIIVGLLQGAGISLRVLTVAFPRRRNRALQSPLNAAVTGADICIQAGVRKVILQPVVQTHVTGWFEPRTRRKIWQVYGIDIGLGGLGVTCSPRDPKLAGSNTAEVDGFS